ncbi:SDR family NAD(P)-dependent oxidoreductase [Streptomyces anulatus]
MEVAFALDGKPPAHVTGASTGTGFEVTQQCAENGYNLLLTAEGAELLQVAHDIRAHGAWVEIVRIDLAETASAETCLTGSRSGTQVAHPDLRGGSDRDVQPATAGTATQRQGWGNPAGQRRKEGARAWNAPRWRGARARNGQGWQGRRPRWRGPAGGAAGAPVSDARTHCLTALPTSAVRCRPRSRRWPAGDAPAAVPTGTPAQSR